MWGCETALRIRVCHQRGRGGTAEWHSLRGRGRWGWGVSIKQPKTDSIQEKKGGARTEQHGVFMKGVPRVTCG